MCFDSSVSLLFGGGRGVPEACLMVSIPFIKVESEPHVGFRGNCHFINYIVVQTLSFKRAFRVIFAVTRERVLRGCSRRAILNEHFLIMR